MTTLAPPPPPTAPAPLQTPPPALPPSEDEKRMTVVEHLTELRRVLIISLLAWLVTTVAAAIFNGQVLHALERPLLEVLGKGNHLSPLPIVTSPTEPLTIPLKVSLIAGFVG